MQDFSEQINSINSKEDFINFLNTLLHDLRANSQDWENKDLDSYFEAMISWTEDMDGYYENMKKPIPKDLDWKVFANILMAAKMYE